MIQKMIGIIVAFVATAIMLTVIQPPIGFSWLAPVSLVPFILACFTKTRPVKLFFIAYIVSFLYWSGNIYWIGFVTISGWVAFSLYTALLWPILVLAIRYCKTKKIPLFIAIPVLVVGAERLQGLFLGGFYWRFLAHSQYANITLIQIADIFGAAGVTFIVAMVNGLLAELILDGGTAILAVFSRAGSPRYGWKGIFKISNLLKTAFMFFVLLAAFFYGSWRINQSNEFIQNGPLVGVVQSALPQSVKDSESFRVNKSVFNNLLSLSKECAKAGAELIVWPETIIPAMLDKGIWAFLIDPESNIFFDKALGEHSKSNCSVLVGAPGGRIRYGEDSNISLEKYNSAFFYLPGGEQSEVKYNKIHLVPFGEIVPFKESAPWLYNLLMKFSPYDFDYNLTAGTEYTAFELKSIIRDYKFGVMICYEGTVPYIARKLTIDSQRRKRIDWLVNISNDGWFVRFKDSKVRPSTELPQHTAAYVFRAVENRVSVLRSVNTGISCIIDPLGRIKNGFEAGSLPKKAMARQGMQGWFADRIMVDKRVTFFSKHGQWLDFCCAILLFSVIILLSAGQFIRNKHKGLSERKVK